MLITLDTNKLIKGELNAHYFIILYLIHEKEYDILIHYLRKTKMDNRILTDIDEMIEFGWLLSSRTEAYDYNKLQPSDKFVELITGGDPFEELVQYYPRFVVRPDGNTDYLLTDLDRASAIYTKIIQKNKALHEHILKCLKEEIDIKEETDNMKYMRRLPKWISERGWESYKDQVRDLESVNGNSFIGYGTAIE